MVDAKITEFDTAFFYHESQLASLMSFSQSYAQKHSSFKIEYERKVATIEKSLIDQNTKLNNHCQNLENQCQSLYRQIIQLIRIIEMLEAKPKQRKLKIAENTNCGLNKLL